MTIARVLRPALAGLFMASALCAQAAPSERIQLCKGSPPARPDEMIIVDSSFRRVPDRTLRLGTIDLSVSRPAATLDNAKVHFAIGSLAKCGDKTVFGLTFDIDDAALPTGDFSIPLSVFREGSNPGDPSLAAAPATVTGTLRRAP